MEGQKELEYVLYFLVRDHLWVLECLSGYLWFGCVYRPNLGAITVDTAFDSMSETEFIMLSP